MSKKLAVKCNVGNCKYNCSNYCDANNISVSASGDGHAKTNDGTICSTFVSEN